MNLQELANDYMAYEYNPNKFESLIDALQCVNDEQAERIQELMETKQFEAFGRYIWNISFEKNEKWAEDRAAYDLGRFPYEEK